MEQRKRRIGRLLVATAILVFLVAGHLAVVAPTSAASHKASGPRNTLTGTTDAKAASSSCCGSSPRESSPSSPTGTSTVPPGGPPASSTSTPIGVIGGVGGGLAVGLLALWAVRSSAKKRNRDLRWVKEHLRAVAGSSPGSPSADIRPRRGALSISIGMEPHADVIGSARIYEVPG
jgi:uncharacterized membrane protein